MLSIVSALVAAPFIALLCYFSLELLLGLRPLSTTDKSGKSNSLIVLIPAHNEGVSIAGTVSHLLDSGFPETARVLVVADNCSDDTARIARDAGAEAIERHHATERGKGYALAFGRDHIRDSGYDADTILVVDADCRITGRDAAKVADAVATTGQIYQIRNLLSSNAGDPPLVQISTFAMLVKNLVRARGLQRLGGGIPLFGTGMAFPWRVFEVAALATGNVVEDMQLALDLARDGTRVRLFEGATVTSLPAKGDAFQEQRSRWEHGFIQTATKHALPLVADGVSAPSRHLLGLGLHLLVPPLALLLALSTIAIAVTGALTIFGANPLPFVILAVALVVALLLVLAAWWMEGRDAMRPAALLRAPLYVLWKIPLYLRYFTNRQRDWNRTRRDHELD